MEKYNQIFEKHNLEISRMNQQRMIWLYASSVVFVGVIIEIYVLDLSDMATLWWVFASIGLLISVNWWYWTMHIVNTLLEHKKSECEILREIVQELSEVGEVIRDSK